MQDIVHYSWLEDSVRFGRLLPLSKKYVISGTPATQAALEREVDAYGDSFTQVTDENGLISAFAECAGQFVHPYDGGQEKPAAQKAKTTRALLEAELSVSRASPAEYRSQFRHLPASVQSSLRDPIRTFAGADVWVYGAKDSIAVKLGLSVMQLLGARVSETLHSGVSHILHIPSDDGASSIGSLEAILPSFKLRLVDKDAAAPGAGAAADGSSTVLIDLQWIEEKRQQVQVAAAERDHAPMQE